MATPVKMGIVGLGRWAKVLTRAVRGVRGKSNKLDIIAAYSRSQSKRDEFYKELACPRWPICRPCWPTPRSRA